MSINVENKCCYKYESERIARALRELDKTFCIGLFLGAYYFLGWGGIFGVIGLSLLLTCDSDKSKESESSNGRLGISDPINGKA